AFVTGAIAILTRNEDIEPKLAVPYGMGMALTLDESALLLELEDVYWSREGLLSLQVTLATSALIGALALAVRFLRRGEEIVLELPLAGHPGVGTTVELGRIGRLADGEHVVETAVGQTAVELRAGIATMVQPDLTVHRELDPEGCAALLGVEEHDVIGRPAVCE